MSETFRVAKAVSLLVETEFNKLRAALLKKGLFVDKIILPYTGGDIDTNLLGNDIKKWAPIWESVQDVLPEAKSISAGESNSLNFFPDSGMSQTKSYLNGFGNRFKYVAIPGIVAKIREETARINAIEAPLGSFTPENLRKLATVFEKQRANSAHENRLFYFANMNSDSGDNSIEYFIGKASPAEITYPNLPTNAPLVRQAGAETWASLFLCSEVCSAPDTLVDCLNRLADNLEKIEGEALNEELLSLLSFLQFPIKAIDLNLKLSDFLVEDSAFSLKLTEIAKNSNKFKLENVGAEKQDGWGEIMHISTKNKALFNEALKNFDLLRHPLVSLNASGQVLITLNGNQAIIYWKLNKYGLSLIPYPGEDTLKEEYKEFGSNFYKSLSPFNPSFSSLFKKDESLPAELLGNSDVLYKEGINLRVLQWNGVKFPLLKFKDAYGLQIPVMESLLLLPEFVAKMAMPEFRKALFLKMAESLVPTVTPALASAKATLKSAKEPAKTDFHGYSKANAFLSEVKTLCREIISLDHELSLVASENYFPGELSTGLTIEASSLTSSLNGLKPINFYLSFYGYPRDQSKEN